MKMVYEILIESALYLAFFLVIGAFFYSALILFKPGTALNINAKFNSWFSTQKVDDTVDMHIDTNEWVLNNRWWVGSLFLMGALFTLKYMLVDFDANIFISLVVRPAGKLAQIFSEIIVISLQWLLVFTSCVGVAGCGLFLVKPEVFQRLSHRLDDHYSTEQFKKGAETVYTALDNWVMKNHILVGLFLFMGSTYLVVFFLMTLM
jgi:hypothetical protein